MKVENKIIRIKDPIYGAEVVLIVCPRDKVGEFTKKKLDYVYIPMPQNQVESCVIEKGGMIKYLIWIPDFNWTLTDQKGLVHEVVHAVFRAMGDRGIKLDPENSEPVAYYLSWLYAELLNKLKESK